MTNNDNNEVYEAQLLKVLAKIESPAEPNIYEAEDYLEKMRARRQAAIERLGLTEEVSFKEPGE